MIIRDQCGNEVVSVNRPRRIVSLVPSQTELLHYLGLENEVVGITRFCIHPREWFQTKSRIGGTKDPDLEKIKKLKPDLIIANREENNRDDVEILRKDFPVYVSDVNDLPSCLEMVRDIGNITSRMETASKLVNDIENAFRELLPVDRKTQALYLIWYRPWMAAGQGTFIHSMLGHAGFENVLQENRYPILEPEQLREFRPDAVLLSSEPFPFKEKHREELQKLLPDSKILLVDGELFSWYGPRLPKAPEYFTALRGYL